MQIQTLFSKIRRPSLRYGLFFGLILGAIQIVFVLTANFITDTNILSLLSTIGLALFIVLGFNAGQRATQETGKLGTAALAGIWTGLVGSALAGVASFILTIINLQAIIATDRAYMKAHPNQFVGYNPANLTANDVLNAFLSALLQSITLYILIALVGSMLGGFLGRRRAPMARAQEPAQEPMQES